MVGDLRVSPRASSSTSMNALGLVTAVVGGVLSPAEAAAAKMAFTVGDWAAEEPAELAAALPDAGGGLTPGRLESDQNLLILGLAFFPLLPLAVLLVLTAVLVVTVAMVVAVGASHVISAADLLLPVSRIFWAPI